MYIYVVTVLFLNRSVRVREVKQILFMYLVFYEVKKCILLFNGFCVKEVGLLYEVKFPQTIFFIYFFFNKCKPDLN